MNRPYGPDDGMIIQEILHRHAYKNENEKGYAFKKCIKPQSSDTCCKILAHNQKVRKYGLFDNGENGQGMARKIMINAMENQIRTVLNFSLSVCLRFASADPVVRMPTETNINRMCIRLKN